jgi:hypothetical protein
MYVVFVKLPQWAKAGYPLGEAGEALISQP